MNVTMIKQVLLMDSLRCAPPHLVWGTQQFNSGNT